MPSLTSISCLDDAAEMGVITINLALLIDVVRITYNYLTKDVLEVVIITAHHIKQRHNCFLKVELHSNLYSMSRP